MESVGSGNGLYHTINVPLDEGIRDEQYTFLFNRQVINVFLSLLLVTVTSLSIREGREWRQGTSRVTWLC